MGYTHYWNMDHVTPDKLQSLVSEMAIICTEASRDLNLEMSLRAGFLLLNGAVTCEDFLFPYPPGFAFCKTLRLPYDKVVTACLALAEHRLGDAIRVSSDGDTQDWEAGCDLASEVVGEHVPVPEAVYDRA